MFEFSTMLWLSGDLRTGAVLKGQVFFFSPLRTTLYRAALPPTLQPLFAHCGHTPLPTTCNPHLPLISTPTACPPGTTQVCHLQTFESHAWIFSSSFLRPWAVAA
uniref:Uncharacterized protein n=1 Tax=Eutreptiella gymnastica TaxID=73025 RepID=A0A7S1ID13_9EUGL|mmetsp:Transcript_148449/g.259450  ORF Transcript_148449/g.259450 Transcript_148449/m.259450 type:complete len:105 (+) Transcript_148449:217-531(+)